MLFSILLLIAIAYVSWRAAPREREEDIHVHGAGQIGLLAALALFGVDYFTSYYYATGEMMSALHPYGMQKYAYFAVAFIGLANFVFGALYIYSLGIFDEGGGSFTASMRYLGPSLSLIVAVVLIQDYVFTIVVSSLSGVDQLLSITGSYNISWFWHFLIGASLAAITWWLTIRGRGESAQIVFTMLGIFGLTTIVMVVGLFIAKAHAVPPVPYTGSITPPVSLGEALYHMLTASMKGLVALTGLEAVSNGVQFVIEEDAGFVKWGKKHLPKLDGVWNLYSGKAGIGRVVQTMFLFYGGLTTLMMTYFAIHFNVFDGTLGRTLIGNLAFIGFTQFPGGEILYWVYQLLAVVLLAAASMTAYQDLQAMTWRNVAVGEIPEVVVYRNPKGTFTRPVTTAAIAAIIIEFLLQGQTSLAVPFYGVGVFLPITAMGLSIREHIKMTKKGYKRKWGVFAATVASVLAAFTFVGQIAGKWDEGGWIVLVSLSALILMAHAILISPIGYRTPEDIHRIIREKSHVKGPMGNIVEWQSLRSQEYRYRLVIAIARLWEWFGVRRPMRYEPPIAAGDYDTAVNHAASESFLDQFISSRQKHEPKLGGPPKETGPGEDEE